MRLQRSPSLHTEAAGASPPDAFGPFRVLHQIGAGTLGPVFRAYDSRREHLVAVKLFKLDLPPERVHRLVAELDRIISAGLTHPALAAPLETGIHDVCAYLVQDYVAAESLDLAVRECGPAPAADALRVAARIGGALDVAAAANIAHGSLHPRDVLLSSDVTQLTGIGVARALERVGVQPPVRRPYTAPERSAGGEWDRRADVFSLAALMHELLWARRVSGTGARAVESLTAIDGGDLSALRATFARALAEDPAERFPTAIEFAEALELAFPSITLARPQTVADRRPSTKSRTTAAEPRLPLLDGPAREAKSTEPPSNVARPPSQAAGEPRRRSSEQDAYGGGLFRSAEEDAAAVDDLALSIAQAEDESFDDVEVRAAIVDVHSRSRTSMWPAVFTLIVGLMIGFASGYGVGTHTRPGASVAAGATAQTPPAVAGREFTESAVAAPAKAASSDRGVRLQPDPQRQPDSVRLKADPTSVGGLPEDAGRLLVRSTPSGATVFVDDREYGQTPVAVRNLAPGAHRVRIARDGYATEERRVAITPSRLAQSMIVALERPGDAASRNGPTTTGVPAPPGTDQRVTGALVVDSRPAGARVFMDGELVGATPLALPTVRAGEHAIRLERDGYRRWSSSVRIVATERNRVTASLER